MSAPLVVNTRDGVCWTRRVVTSGGLALYAPESVRTCPDFVMATLEELAEHGIVGSADALPMPVREEPQEPAAEQPLAVFRASHDSIVMGLYTTPEAARAHCEAEERRSWGETSAPTNFDWIEDEEDGVAEMTAFVGGEERTTGYVVTALEVAAAYDPDGDE